MSLQIIDVLNLELASLNETIILELNIAGVGVNLNNLFRFLTKN
jgi:hypothetical protein